MRNDKLLEPGAIAPNTQTGAIAPDESISLDLTQKKQEIYTHSHRNPGYHG